MSINFIFKDLTNLSTSVDYLKKANGEIRIVSVEEQTMVLEIPSALVALNNSILMDFSVEFEKQSLKLVLTCKVVDFEVNNNTTRIGLKLTQYNKKDWAALLNFMEKKQSQSTKLLKNMRGI